jgi:hypothetical protein
MNWKDTVITRDSITGLTFGDEVWKLISDLLELQAEISFKAGMRDVVEWFRTELGDNYPIGTQLLDDKLKEWGIE